MIEAFSCAIPLAAALWRAAAEVPCAVAVRPGGEGPRAAATPAPTVAIAACRSPPAHRSTRWHCPARVLRAWTTSPARGDARATRATPWSPWSRPAATCTTTGEDEDALEMIARAAQALGQTALAAAAYERLAAASTPTTPSPWCRRRGCTWSLKDARGAERLANEALGRDERQRRGLPGARASELGSGRPPRGHPLPRASTGARAGARLGAEQPRLRLPARQRESRGAGDARAGPRSCSPTAAVVHNNLGVALRAHGHRRTRGGLRPGVGAARPEVRQGPGERRAHRMLRT